jgi:hypothetical protein
MHQFVHGQLGGHVRGMQDNADPGPPEQRRMSRVGAQHMHVARVTSALPSSVSTLVVLLRRANPAPSWQTFVPFPNCRASDLVAQELVAARGPEGVASASSRSGPNLNVRDGRPGGGGTASTYWSGGCAAGPAGRLGLPPRSAPAATRSSPWPLSWADDQQTSARPTDAIASSYRRATRPASPSGRIRPGDQSG